MGMPSKKSGEILGLYTPYCTIHMCPVYRAQYGVRNFSKRQMAVCVACTAYCTFEFK